MNKTIKQLADELGVSKTAIRKRLTPDFREKYVETDANGTILVSAEGANLLKSLRKPPETFAETFAETENPKVSDSSAAAFQAAIEALKAQLEAKDRQIEALQKALDQEQKLHAATIQKQPLLEDGSLKRRWWQFLKKNKE